MLLRVLVSPRSFKAELLADKGIAQNAIQLLQRVRANGVLLEGSDRGARRLLQTAATEISMTGPGQTLRECATEVLKQHKSRIIAYPVEEAHGDPAAIRHLVEISRPDLIVVAPDEVEEMVHTLPGRDVVAIDDYGHCDCARRHTDYVESPPYIDCLSRDEFKEILSRALTTANWVRLYDPYIGRSRRRLGRFLTGIQFVLNRWAAGLHPGCPQPHFLEIYTCLPHTFDPADESDRSREMQENHDAAIAIQEGLLNRLRFARRPFTVEIHFKEHREFRDDERARGVFRDRYLETRSLIISLHGFDFFEQSGAPRRSSLKIEVGVQPILRSLRELPDQHPKQARLLP